MQTTSVRLVKCPKCLKILPESTDVPIYECGGCGARLQAKNIHSTIGGKVEEQSVGPLNCNASSEESSSGKGKVEREDLPAGGKMNRGRDVPDLGSELDQLARLSFEDDDVHVSMKPKTRDRRNRASSSFGEGSSASTVYKHPVLLQENVPGVLDHHEVTSQRKLDPMDSISDMDNALLEHEKPEGSRDTTAYYRGLQFENPHRETQTRFTGPGQQQFPAYRVNHESSLHRFGYPAETQQHFPANHGNYDTSPREFGSPTEPHNGPYRYPDFRGYQGDYFDDYHALRHPVESPRGRSRVDNVSKYTPYLHGPSRFNEPQMQYEAPTSPAYLAGPALYPEREAPVLIMPKFPKTKINIKKRQVRPRAGGAPFITCPCCVSIIFLPADFLLFRKRCHRLRCGVCSEVLKFSLLGKTHLAPYVPALEARQSGSLHTRRGSVDYNARTRSFRGGPYTPSPPPMQDNELLPLHHLMGYPTPRDLVLARGSSRTQSEFSDILHRSW